MSWNKTSKRSPQSNNKKGFCFWPNSWPWKRVLSAKVDQRLWNAEHKTLVVAVYHRPRGLEDSLSEDFQSSISLIHKGLLWLKPQLHAINHWLHEKQPVWVSGAAKNGCCWSAGCIRYTSGIQISRLHVDALVTLNRCPCICQHTPIEFW